MRIEQDVKLDFSDVLIKPKRSTLTSRKDVELERVYKFKWGPYQINPFGKDDYQGVPIMAANMDGVGTFEMVDALIHERMFTCLNKHYTADELIKWINTRGGFIPWSWAYTLGITNDDRLKLDKVCDKIMNPIKYINIDVANGYTQKFVDFVTKFRDYSPNTVIIAGNVATPEMTEELILSGADIVKVGIGPGSVCTTRIKTGVGYPQLSAIIECADAAHGLGGHIIADGGCTSSGDIAKAFGAGADFVMLGGMLAGHKEGGGFRTKIEMRLKPVVKIERNGIDVTLVDNTVEKWDKYTIGDLVGSVHPAAEHYEIIARLGHDFFDRVNVDPEIGEMTTFHGMSSKEAMEKHHGGKADYKASEGKSVSIPYRGEVRDTVVDILGGLRSACSYVGASSLKELSKRTTFVMVNNTHNRIFGNDTA